MSSGTLYEITNYLDEHHSGFFVARVIMSSGVQLRRFGRDDRDDPDAIARVQRTLETLMSDDDLAELRRQLGLEAGFGAAASPETRTQSKGEHR